MGAPISVPTETARVCAPKTTTYAPLGRLYPGISRLGADFNPTLLRGFIAIEPLQKVEMTSRDGFLRRLSIGRAKLLPDGSSNGLP
jgi:hypothetical protein